MYTLNEIKSALLKRFNNYTFDIKEDEDSLSACTTITLNSVSMMVEFFISLTEYQSAMVKVDQPFKDVKDLKTMKEILIGDVLESENHNLLIAYVDENMDDIEEIMSFVNNVLTDITDMAFINAVR